MQGAEYSWQLSSWRASLLWRSENDYTPASQWSGSVICLGNLTDQIARAVVFQNYQIMLHTDPVNPNLGVQGSLKDIIILAGFLLPQEIKSATIIVDDNSGTRRNPDTLPRRSQDIPPGDRRSFSAL